MRESFRKILLVVLTTVLISFVWLRYPHLFPSPPEPFSLFIVDLFNVESQEDVADIEFFYVFFMSVIIAALLALFPYKKMLESLSKR